MSKIINSLRKCFTQIPNAIVTDQSLSDGALRVFLYMSTKPDDWQFNNRDIQHKLNIKRAETIAKYWKELIQSGWIGRQPIINENGKPTGYFDYILNFEPQIPTPQNADIVPTTDKPYTLYQQIRENRTYTNKEVVTNNKNKNTPLPPKGENGGDTIWLQIAKNLNLVFNDDEQAAISNWAEYISAKQKSFSDLQIKTNLQSLAKLKTDGYNISSMINDTISAGYKWLLKPTPIYLLKNVSVGLGLTSKPHAYRYDNPEYIVPESKSDKHELRNYLERCYMRELVDPRTGLTLTSEQKALFKAHYDFAKSQHISITEYIYQNEVLTGSCLLDQPITGKNNPVIDSVA